MIKFLYLFIGGGIGTILRYVISGIGYRILGVALPWGTVAVNVLGSLVIGFFWSYIDVSIVRPEMKLFLFMGLLGGFTTFSTFMLEFMNMFRDHEIGYALFYLFLTNLLGIIFVFSGYLVGKYVRVVI